MNKVQTFKSMSALRENTKIFHKNSNKINKKYNTLY